NVAQIEAFALERGLAKSRGEIDLAVRAQAALQLIMERSVDSQGQFNRELDTTGGALSEMRAEAQNAAAEAGEHLQPAMQALIEEIRTNVLPGLGQLAEGTLPAISDA